MDCFHYPLDTETLLRKKRKLRRELLAQNPHPLHKKIAILGGSTTNEVADQLGLFLLQYGIEAEFYQSEYAQYWQDAMFGTPELDDFHPDVIYIHTNWRNLTALPTTADSGATTVVPTPAPAAPQPPAPDEHTGKGGLYIRSGGQRTLVDRTKQPTEATAKE